jgi:hypothetical protein
VWRGRTEGNYEPSVSEGDLGQKEAELEKAGKDQMSHMEGGDATKNRK